MLSSDSYPLLLLCVTVNVLRGARLCAVLEGLVLCYPHVTQQDIVHNKAPINVSKADNESGRW